MTTQDRKKGEIIRAALEAATFEQAVEVNEMICADVGAEYQRPVGDRFNNYGLMAASGGSYEYKALEPVTNQQDSVLERQVAARFGANPSKVPYDSPEEAAGELLGKLDYRAQADQITVAFRESDRPTRSSKRLTIVYRDQGCGMTAEQVPTTIFGLGSSHKNESRWQQGAFGLGGASTYRNARAVVLVTRRAPEMEPAEDRITVAVVQWQNHGKGESAFYLTESDWGEGVAPGARPWSAPASVFPDFEPGTQLALISYGTEGFHRARSGDERSFDMVLNTRLYRPILPVRFTNEISRGRNEYLRGLARRLEENPSPDRHSDEEEMLYTYGGHSYRLPVRYVVFPGGTTGIRRRFVAKDHALIFTSNGQVHHHWTPAQLKQRTKLSKIHERVFVEVETDALPIELRTTLFTPDRSELLANEQALQLEDQVVDFLVNWERLVEINNDLVREAISGATSGGSALEVARKISTALKLKGFKFDGQNGNSAGPGASGGRRKRKKVATYPDPTALEGPDRLVVEDGKVRLLTYMLNAEDGFFESGRGELTFDCDHPDLDVDKHLVVGRLRDGYVRVQLQVPEGAAEGEYDLVVRLADWHKAAGGIGAPMEYRTKLEVVDEVASPKTGAGTKKGGKGSGEGVNVAVLWRDADEHGDGWHNGVPGGVEMVPAVDLAEKEEYAPLASLGDQKIPTIVFNKEYAPFKSYISTRAKDLGEKGVSDTKDRYAVGLGLGLLLLNEDFEKRAEKDKEPIDPRVELTAKAAVARSVLLMMPAFDTLIKEAGLSEE
jgi:hypothetical protein